MLGLYIQALCYHFIFFNTSQSIRITKASKTFHKLFLFDYNDVRAFEVFKWTTGSIFKCEITNMKLPKNIKKIFEGKTSFFYVMF